MKKILKALFGFMICFVIGIAVLLYGVGKSLWFVSDLQKETSTKVQVEEDSGKDTGNVAVSKSKEGENTENVQKFDDSKSESTQVQNSGISPDLKAFLESYEAFMDEYVEFMKSYDTSDMKMLVKYLDLIQKYAEFAKTADDLDIEDMNTEEALYYTEVMLRISGKLLEVSVGN